jgi:hypothetical protein
MTIDVLIIKCYTRAVLFMNYSILSLSCCYCTNIYYIMILIGSCPYVLCLTSSTYYLVVSSLKMATSQNM